MRLKAMISATMKIKTISARITSVRVVAPPRPFLFFFDIFFSLFFHFGFKAPYKKAVFCGLELASAQRGRPLFSITKVNFLKRVLQRKQAKSPQKTKSKHEWQGEKRAKISPCGGKQKHRDRKRAG